MMKHVAFKLAASTLVLGLTTISCKPLSIAHRPAAALLQSVAQEQKAADLLHGKARMAAARGDFATALAFMERVVLLTPQDQPRRVALADLYLRNGRFQSADAAYADALTLAPDDQRAALSRVLVRIAMGDQGAALAELDGLSTIAPASNVGLAYALAGQPQRAIGLLENAARAEGADARVRQNLALSYALAGDWQKARVTALQDISPADIDARMERWAAFTSPRTSYDQVAGMLGVTPVQDPGRPSQLALAPVTFEPAALAAVEPAPAPPQAAAVETATVEASSVAQPTREPQAAQVHYAAAAAALVAPQPAVISASPQVSASLLPAFELRKKGLLTTANSKNRALGKADGRYVVQIGAYASASYVQKAWTTAHRRYLLGADTQPLTTTVTIPGRGRFHRLSVAGFDSRGDAADLCMSIRARGGACFVRVNAGDAPVRWANRSGGRGEA